MGYNILVILVFALVLAHMISGDAGRRDRGGRTMRPEANVENDGMKFEIIKGEGWAIIVKVLNVEGVGNVHQVAIKGSSTEWLQMTRSSDQNWQISAMLQGQSLSFQVTTSDGKMVQSDNIAPPDWQFGVFYPIS